MKHNNGPQALLLISSQCPHCHVMQGLLNKGLQDGRLAVLDVINIEESPETAQAYNVRSVPWLQLNGMVFDSALTPAEMDRWIEIATQETAQSSYLEYLLLNGKLSNAITRLEEGESTLSDLLPLIVKEGVKINVRVGIGAIIEHFEGSPILREVLPQLSAMSKHQDAMVRADVCHYLLLTHAQESAVMIEGMLKDSDTQVREIAQECLLELGNDLQ